MDNARTTTRKIWLMAIEVVWGSSISYVKKKIIELKNLKNILLFFYTPHIITNSIVVSVL